jgi:hypothetical protein
VSSEPKEPKPPSAKGGKKEEAYDAPLAAERVYSYSLPVDPTLFGKLRIRCWASGEERPSKSAQLTLPRWNGNAGVDAKLQMVVDERAAYFRKLAEHVSHG